MSESELNPPFEVEFPDPENGMTSSTEKRLDLGQINGAEARMKPVVPIRSADSALVQPTTEITEPQQNGASSKPSHPDGPPYRSGHPIKTGPRINTVGDANSGDMNLR
jgi:hypothetical protein